MHRSQNKLIKAARRKCEDNYTLTQEPVVAWTSSAGCPGWALGPSLTLRAGSHHSVRGSCHAVSSPLPGKPVLLRPEIRGAAPPHYGGPTPDKFRVASCWDMCPLWPRRRWGELKSVAFLMSSPKRGKSLRSSGAASSPRPLRKDPETVPLSRVAVSTEGLGA